MGKVRSRVRAALISGVLAASPAVTQAASIILSTQTGATLGGLTFEDGSLADYDIASDTATLAFDEALFSGNENIDAVHVLSNGNFILSTANAATLGGLTFDPDDLVEYNPNTDVATLFFSGSNFSATNEDIDAVSVLSNGHIVLSTTATATLGGLGFDPDDLVDYDPITDIASLVFDGGALFTTSNEDIDAVSILPGSILLSTLTNATLGGLSFDAGDVVAYDLLAGTATLFFDHNSFAESENVDAIFVTPLPATVWFLGSALLGLFAARRKQALRL